MAEKTNSLYLLVLLAMSDHHLDTKETHKIIKISKELKREFYVHDAVEEIHTRFKDDFDSACDYYMSHIDDEKIRRATVKYMHELVVADAHLAEREVRFLEKVKAKWGKQYF